MRRARLLLLAALVVASVLPAAAPTQAATRHGAEALPTRTPIKHFITLMQENHSFDNYFGTYPGADGIPAGVCMPKGDGGCVRPWRIGDSAIEDLGHNLTVFERQYDSGRLDGFVSAFADARMQDTALPMGHYDRRDLPFYWNVADSFVLFDRNFTSAHAGSVANHMYWVTGTPGGSTESIPPGGFTAPTIFDRLDAAGISWKFYVENYDPSITFRQRGASDRGSQVIWCPLLAYARFLDDPGLNQHIVPLDDYYSDLEAGTLPAVSYLVPAGSSEHPPGSIAAGEAFVSNLISGLMRSTAWPSSAFMWTYDDWGGWYDHVPPPEVDRYGYGFRAPALLVSAFARKGFVDHTQVDFTSQLRFIESNWGLPPLARRDAAANGLDSAFDFGSGPRAPAFVSREVHPTRHVVGGQAVVYRSYSAGVALFALVVGWGMVQSRRPRPGREGRGRLGWWSP